MELSKIVANQVLIIFGLVLVGFFLARAKKLTEKGAKEMTTVLLSVVTPCVLISSYEKPFNAGEVKNLGIAAAFALTFHVFAIFVSTVIFKKQKDENHRRINTYSAIYSNCGFMAIPLLNAALGSQGVFFGSMYLAVFTPLYWTHGIWLYTGGGKNEISLKKGFINPGVIGTFVSMLLFFSGFWFKTYPAPFSMGIGVLKSVIGYIASLNTPLAMLVLGYYLSEIDFISCLKKPSLYAVCFVRLLALPLAAVIAVHFINIPSDVAKAIIIPAACPAANITALFAAKYNLDAEYASQIVSISTVFSVLTIPLVVFALGF